MEKLTQKKAEREFLICDYREDSTGKMRCKKPKMLPCGGDGSDCRVWIHDCRDRGDGPGFGLMVVYCKTHDRYFTVYPPGWAPYERGRVVPADEAESNTAAWKQTLFHSAVCGDWLGQYVSEGGTRWHTHRRRLVRCGQLLGLSTASGCGEEVAAILGIQLQVQGDARRLFACCDLASQRRAIASVLAAVVVDERLWRQMARAGHAAGVWGVPWYWTSADVLERLFQPPERPAVSSVSAGAEFDP